MNLLIKRRRHHRRGTCPKSIFARVIISSPREHIGAATFLPLLSMSEKDSIHQDTYLKVLRLLEANSQMSQRELAAAVGVSLGKTNFCLKALLDKGLLKMQNFQNSKRKLAYAYLLTPSGIAEKTALTGRFLKRKMNEYELLKAEIASLQQETFKNNTEIETLLGDHTKANQKLGWVPETTLDEMVQEMVAVDLADAKKHACSNSMATTSM